MEKKSFGEVQARTYAESISLAIRALKKGRKAVSLCGKNLDEVQGGQFVGHLGQEGYIAAGANLHCENFDIPHQ